MVVKPKGPLTGGPFAFALAADIDHDGVAPHLDDSAADDLTLATEITFGKADKFDKVDAMLDALRREMAMVRAGG